MLGNVFFFTGENTYALSGELVRWKKKFREKHGDENFSEVTAKQASFSDLLDLVSAMPFIAEKRLVVIQGLPKLDKDEFKSLLDALNEQIL